MFEAIQSKVILGLAVPVIILSQRQQFSMTTLVTQMILYLALAYNTDCLVSGRCSKWAWVAILFPLIQTIGYLFFNSKLDLRMPIRLPVPKVNTTMNVVPKATMEKSNESEPAPIPTPAPTPA